MQKVLAKLNFETPSRALVFLFAATLLFVVVQFGILAVLGTKGGEIAQIRVEMESLRIENEHLRAEIDKAKTIANIQADSSVTDKLSPVGVERIVVGSTEQVVSQNN